MSKDFTVVKPFAFWTQHVLPLVYGDEISYMETLNKVVKLLNELINNNNQLPEYIQKVVEEYITSGDLENVIRGVIADFILNVKYPPTGITPAVGDGTKDDTAAIQGCIDYAFNQGGGVVYFPYGSYLTDSITMRNGVSLLGFDRYSSKIVLKGGATKPLLQGANISDVGLYDLTFDGNSGVQVNDVDLINILGSDCQINNVICKDGYTGVIFNGLSGHLQIENVVFGNFVKNCVTISGRSKVQVSDVLFNGVSRVGGVSVIEINASNGKYGFDNVGVCPVCCIIGGNDNYVEFACINASEYYTDNGLRNNIVIHGVSEKKQLAGDVDVNVVGTVGFEVDDAVSVNVGGNYSEVVNGNKNVGVNGTLTTDVKNKVTETYRMSKEENVIGNKTLTVTGNSTETITQSKTENISENLTENVKNKTVNVDMLFLNTKEPIQYVTPKVINENYKSIPFKDANNQYDVLVKGDVFPPTSTQFITNNFVLGNSGSFVPHKEGSKYYKLQGFTADENNFYFYLVDQPNKNGELWLVNRNTGVSMSKEYSFGHGNCMTCDNEYLYIVGVYNDNNSLIKLTKNTLTVVTSYQLPAYYNGIAFDKVTNVFYGRSYQNVYVLDISETSVTPTLLFEVDSKLNFTGQGMFADNNHIYYVTSSPESIICFNLDGSLNQWYLCNNIINDIYPLGELEDAELVDGVIYTSSYIRWTPSFIAKNKTVTQVFFGNIGVSAPTIYYSLPFDRNNNMLHNRIYVDSNSNVLFRNGSTDNPCCDINEAYLMATVLYANTGKKSIIYVKTTDEQFGADIRGNAVSTISASGVPYFYVKHLNLIDTDITINNMVLTDTSENESCMLYIVGSRVVLNRIGWPSNINDIANTVSDIINVSNSVLNCLAIGTVGASATQLLSRGISNFYASLSNINVSGRIITRQSGINPYCYTHELEVSRNVTVTTTNTLIPLNRVVGETYPNNIRWLAVVDNTSVPILVNENKTVTVGGKTITFTWTDAKLYISASSNATLNELYVL